MMVQVTARSKPGGSGDQGWQGGGNQHGSHRANHRGSGDGHHTHQAVYAGPPGGTDKHAPHQPGGIQYRYTPLYIPFYTFIHYYMKAHSMGHTFNDILFLVQLHPCTPPLPQSLHVALPTYICMVLTLYYTWVKFHNL